MNREQIIKSSPYKPIPVKVIGYTKETHDAFTIRLDWGLDHDPGQFVFCSLPGIGEAPISICSSSRKYLDLNIRVVGSVTSHLANIKKGDTLLVRGPYGKAYPMDLFSGKSFVIVGGGSGVAPLKGVIEFIEQHPGEYKDVSLYLGFRSPEDVMFSSALKRWIQAFHLYVSFDKLTTKATFGGKEGFVTGLVEEHVVQTKDQIVFLCGPPMMIQKTAEILLAKGFKEEQIYISAERLMYCGIGKCGRCMIHGKYTCLDGAVFRYDELKDFKDD